MGRPITLLGLCIVASWLGASAAQADPPPYFIGESWEAGIARGITSQDRVRKRQTVQGLVGEYSRKAHRQPTVENLYLLGRAYGLRFSWHLEQAKAARSAGESQRHEAEAAHDHAEAMAAYRDALKQAPRCYFAYHDMGVLELQRSRPDRGQAFDHLRNAYTVNDRYTPVLRRLITLYLEGKQHAVAVPLLQRLLQFDAEDVEARRRLVLAYLELDKIAEATREVDRLLQKNPNHPAYWVLQVQVDIRTGNFDRAIRTCKRLARLNPNVPTAFKLLLLCLEGVHKKTGEQPPLDEYLYALKGLHRITRDPRERAKLKADIRKLEELLARGPAPGPGDPKRKPTTADLLRVLSHEDPKARVKALLYLTVRKERPTQEVMRAMAHHASPTKEKEGAVRAVAVSCLGRLGGTRLIPLLRHALDDADAGVRAEAADTLVDIALRDDGARAPVILLLGLHAGDKDVKSASAARQGVLTLAQQTLEGVGEADDVAHRKAFAAWWQGAAGENLQIEALDTYHRLGDRSADQVLVPYLESSSFFVFRAAYRALKRAAPGVDGDVFKRWFATLPSIADAELIRENWNRLKTDLSAWVARRPR